MLVLALTKPFGFSCGNGERVEFKFQAPASNDVATNCKRMEHQKLDGLEMPWFCVVCWTVFEAWFPVQIS